MSESARPGAARHTSERLEERLDALLGELGGRTALAAQRISGAGGRGRTLRVAPTGQAEQAGQAGDDAPATREPGRRSEIIRLRADEALPAASLAKLPVAFEVLRRVDLGQCALDEPAETEGEPRVGGRSLLDLFSPRTRLTLGDLCALMLAASDNTAANFLLDFVGMGEVNETLARLNLPSTRLARHFMDFAARDAHRDNLTSAGDMVSLLALLAGNALPGAKVVRTLLAGQLCFDEVLAWLPPGAELAHKSGDLDDVINDAGILRGPGGSCVYAVLTAEQADLPAVRRVVCAAVRAVYDAWCAG